MNLDALTSRLAELEDIQADNFEAWAIVTKSPEKFWARQLKDLWSLIEETEIEIQIVRDRISKAIKEGA